MKTLLLTFGLLFGGLAPLHAQDPHGLRVETVSGNGLATGFCRGGPMGSYCLDRLEDDAERAAERDGDLNCRLRNGQLRLFSQQCYTYCTPSSLVGDRDEYVSCRASCQFACEIL